MTFLSTTREEMLEQGFENVDFAYVSGDAYVDHPSFGCAAVTRTLQAYGYSCVTLPQSDWYNDEEFTQFGEPRLGFLVSAGDIDSMVNHYSVNKRRRDKNSYSDEGVMGKRSDRPITVYTQILKRPFPHKPVLIGGIEANLRRLSHYDYWGDKVRRSTLINSQADLLMHGMGENTIIEVADVLNSGLRAKDLCYIRGTHWKTKVLEYLSDCVLLPSYEEVCADKHTHAKSFHIQHENIDIIATSVLVEPCDDWYVVQNQPPLPLTQEEMDFTYLLPHERTYHPRYTYVPAIEEVQFSIVSNRGCFGSCAFYAITHHQGCVISTRSRDSIVDEAKRTAEMPNFKDYIHDVGGSTANFSKETCDKRREYGACKNRECLFPKGCVNLKVGHSRHLEILRVVRALPRVKKVFIRSSIRYDYLMYDKNDEFFDELVQHHISRQLKVTSEHINAAALDKTGRPRRELYLKFVDKFKQKNEQLNRSQFIVPYLMSSHPGNDLQVAIELACYLKKIRYTPKQVQDFYPTPGTSATCMYYTSLDPKTMCPVYVTRTHEEKAMQRALMQFTYPQNYDLVYKALKTAGRMDLVGNSPKCLIPYRKGHTGNKFAGGRQKEQHRKPYAGKASKPQRRGKRS